MTDAKKMENLNNELINEVENYAENEDCSTKNAFTHVFIEKLNCVDSGEFKLQDIEIKSYRNDNENMRINGYAINTTVPDNEGNENLSFVTIVVSEMSSSHTVKQMGEKEATNLLKMGADFYIKAKEGFFKNAIDYSSGAEIADALFSDGQSSSRVHIILITNKIVESFDLNPYSKEKQLFHYDIWDLERLYENKPDTDIVIDFEKYGLGTLSLLKVPEKSDLYDCYVGAIPGETLAKIFEIEDYRLFEKNIRVYLNCGGKINKGIKSTIKNNPSLFVAYNNGISTIADSIDIESISNSGDIYSIKKIRGWQIVNGAQTTSTLFDVYNSSNSPDILKDIFVQIKLIILHEALTEEQRRKLIYDIALFANSQNPIKASDFSAMEDYPKEMYSLSTTTALLDSCGKKVYPFFYEHARGRYDAYKGSKCHTASEIKTFERTTKKISKIEAAKAQMLWVQPDENAGPYIVAKGGESAYVKFLELVKKGTLVNSHPSQDDYITLIGQYIIYATTIKIIKKEAFGDWRSQQVCYTIALLREHWSQLADFKKIWNEQTIDIELAEKIKELAYVVWDYFMSIDGSKNIGQWCKKRECWEALDKYYNEKNKV